MPRKRCTSADEFKRQMVQLYKNGKSRTDVVNEYELIVSALGRWIKQAEHSGSFSEKINHSPEENEVSNLRKENQRLKLEVDILKQAALIMGRK